MAVPKKKMSKSRTRRRKATHKISNIVFTAMSADVSDRSLGFAL